MEVKPKSQVDAAFDNVETRAFWFTIQGETVPQKNSQNFFRGRVVKSARFTAWRDSALRQLREQGVPAEPLECAKIWVRFVHSDMRRRDGDNQLSSVQDLLVKAGVIADDCWTRIGTPTVDHAAGSPARCEITVVEAPADYWKSREASA